ncbi:hypothetical protein BH11PSE8_BH11PSE8_16300 [soil metagenome]
MSHRISLSSLCCLALAATTLAAGMASAQTTAVAAARAAAPAASRPSSVAPSVYTPVAPGDDTLYQALGGQAGLVKLTDDFLVRLLADERMNPFFKDIDEKDFKKQLTKQFCEVSGGPCKLESKGMKHTHSGYDIDKSHFNRLVEVLQQSMDAQGIAFGAQNRLLAQLAPMHRDIVNVR